MTYVCIPYHILLKEHEDYVMILDFSIFFFLPIMIKSSLSHAFLAMCTDNAPGIATHLHLPYVYKGSAARCYYVIHDFQTTIASTPRVNFQTAAVWKTLILIDAARATRV